MIRLLLLLLLVPVACKKEPPERPTPEAKSPPAHATPQADDPIRTAWSKLDGSANGCPEEFDYFPNGGMRNLACHLKTVVSLADLEALGGRVFRAGPHEKSDLVLSSERDFGRYDPRFVEWLVSHGVPGAKDEAFRARTQPVYDKALKTLARAYLRAHEQLKRNPWYAEQEREYLLEYLEKGRGTRPVDRHAELEPPEMYNIYAPAVAFWIRRSVDGTEAQFSKGLSELLRTYDPEAVREVAEMDLTIQKPGAPQPGAGAIADGPIDGMLREAWSRFGETQIGCNGQFEYKPGGARVNYCYLEPILDFARFRKKVGMTIFSSGPHGSTLNLDAERDFGRYNPAFVRWVIDHAIPGAGDRALAAATQSAYDARMRVAARAFYTARLLLKEDRSFFEGEKKRYERFLKEGGDKPFWSYWEKMPGQYEAQAIGGTGLAFWLRRSMDGTDHLFEQALEKLLATYDREFLDQAKRLGFTGLAARPDLFQPGG